MVKGRRMFAAAKWSVIRREDGEVMEGNIQTKEEAASKMELLIKEV